MSKQAAKNSESSAGNGRSAAGGAAKKTAKRARKATPSHVDSIHVKGAAEHNLRNVELKLPKFKLVVFSGVSGSGKSSLAFDTIYAEGQRRYVESLSSYARQFLGQMEKPKYERITGLSPTISIEQKAASNNPRSTVGTITEVYDYLRVLFARIGRQHCHVCKRPVQRQSAAEIVDRIAAMPEGRRYLLLARLVENRKGEHRELLHEAVREGFGRFRIDGEVYPARETPKLDKKKKHTIDVVVDRLAGTDKPDGEFRARLTDSVETALNKGGGMLICAPADGAEELYSEHLFCHHCNIGFPELSPQNFSFNSPLGMCPDCNGLGTKPEMDPGLVVPHPELSVNEGAIEPWARILERGDGWSHSILASVAEEYDIDFDKPFNKLPKRHRNILLYGSGGRTVTVQMDWDSGTLEWERRFEGVLNQLYRRFRQTKSEGMRKYYMRYLSEHDCSTCGGRRLRAESDAVLVSGVSLPDLSGYTIVDARKFVAEADLTKTERMIAEEVIKEIDGRLGFLENVGLGYLSLDRPGPSLSGGESQRIRLASQIGSELTGVLYILDEPSIGLHQRDNGRLLATLERLRDIGNTVIVVEHDAETIEQADHVVDFGPGAGVAGGEVVFSGTPAQLRRSRKSLTGKYLSGKLEISVPGERRPGSGKVLKVKGARANNLKNLDVEFPLETFIAVTGVSGAGKSTLVNGILYPALMRTLHGSRAPVGEHGRIVGAGEIDKVIDIDQRPIGRTPRSNPATYTKVFDQIREIYSMTPEARTFGYKPGRFSFNVKGGRCEACGGDGVRQIEMHFLPDVYVPCEVCGGKRFNDATLRVRFKGRNISEVLGLTVNQALEHFSNHPKLTAGLQTLADVGLGYIQLGQPSPTLSGGEAQRIKLSRELSKRATGNTLYILDEPTTGLHFDDIKKLLVVLNRLVDAGNTVVVIEHNLDVIKCADHVIDIGPEGGDAGGAVVATGTPEQLTKVRASYTGRYLKSVL